METKEMQKKELSLLKKIRKKIFLSFLNEKRAIKGKIPDYLKNDVDVVEELVKMFQKPETKRQLIRLIDNNPWAINLLKPEYIKSYSRDLDYDITTGKYDKKPKPAIKFLSLEKQKELLLNNDAYVYNSSLTSFSSEAIMQAYIENEKSGGKLFDEFEIEELQQDLQLKIALLNNKYIEKMSTEAQIAFVNNNPYLISKLGKNAIPVVLQANPQLEQFLVTDQEYTRTQDVDEIKKLIYSCIDWNHRIDMSKIEDIELFKFYPQLLSEVLTIKWNNENINPILQLMITNISKYPNQLALVNFFNEFKNRFDYDPYKSEEYFKIEEMMKIGLKLISNDDILKSVDGEDLKDYIENPRKIKLLEIIERTYGTQARRILEDRPNIDIDKIENFYIFSPKAIEEFSIGAIHHLLSYKNIKSPMIISELVRYPEKMTLYKKFDMITKEYFEETPVGIEEKLNTFLNLYDFIKTIEKEELTEDMRNNFILCIDDFNKIEPINPINIKNVNDLKSYATIRKEKFEEAIKKTTDIVEVKNLICKEFLGMSYYKRESGTVDKKHMSMQDIIYKYNIDKFVNDSRTLNSGFFSEEELDIIELLSIIHKINDVAIMKEIAETLSNSQDTVINPVFFKDVRDKIPMQYSKELVKELLTPEKTKKMVKEGVEGISYKEEDGYFIIKLTGADFLLYVHNMNSYMSECHNLIFDEYKRWTEYEDGVSTISGILMNQERTERFTASRNVGFFQINPNQILGMGADDINTTHGKRRLNIDFNHQLQFDYPRNLVRKSQGKGSLKHYAEVVSARRKQNVKEIEPGTFGGKIMPDYVLGGINDEEGLKKFAKQMKTNIIIEIDDEAYKDKEYEQLRQEAAKRKETKFMKKIKEIISDDGER